ncbi:hypothetical protein GT037_001512 [Alternaria burnsii]|uniref:Uncharacterized protein n=1 Tax=Alternaria burnsii TaxID=1187904 RepID=A0A8H7EIB6_9PLEO|nr:uncharacterized protein GT037_001512 [Alternaria burnsii]KAF7679861.1 hypothetical protein GT037_001512 [Alternaria burnsii]
MYNVRSVLQISNLSRQIMLPMRLTVASKSIEREEITEPLLCQAAQVTESRWRTQRFPRELELQIQQNCVGLTEPQGNQNERRFENFEESRTPAYTSNQHTIGCSPTTTFYRGLQIVKTAIDQGLIYRVYEPTQAYIVGWVDLLVQVACIQLVLPSSSTQDLEELPSIPICLVKKHDALSCSGSKWVDLTSLEESYRPFLEDLHALLLLDGDGLVHGKGSGT